MATEETRPNFFNLLELNPDEPWDQTIFEQALRKKQSAWRRDTLMVGQRVLDATKYLDLVDEIRRVMLDPIQRTAHAALAQAEGASGKHTKIEHFQVQLELAQQKGYLEEQEFDRLVEEYKDVL